MNYTFVCKNCSPTGLETYRKVPACKSSINLFRAENRPPSLLFTPFSHYADVHDGDSEYATGVGKGRERALQVQPGPGDNPVH